jgi:hypothetical protein
MSKEYLVGDTIVACLTINNPTSSGTYTSEESFFSQLSDQLRAICQLPKDDLHIINGFAYNPLYANNEDPTTGCSWIKAEKCGGFGLIVLFRVDQPEIRIRVSVKLVVAKDDSKAWLTVEYNPTTMTVGSNVHPAPFFDPATGLEHSSPSSSWAAMSRAFALGFRFLEAMADGVLFNEETKFSIERGDMHLASAQWAATKPVNDISSFLQLMCVIYGHTIARGKGIINNATHLGLKFTPYTDTDTHLLNGVMFRKFHGTKPQFTVSLYDKRVRLEQMHQSLEDLSDPEKETVMGSVREDITAHSEAIITIVKAAQRHLLSMGEAAIKFFDFISPEVFLAEEPKATVWWLQRAIFILSHRFKGDDFRRFSFASWLVPYIEQQVLRFDVIAAITSKGFHQLLALDDKVAEAWRTDPTPGAEDWAGRYALASGCARATVYNRQAKFRKTCGIDIAYPLALYRDILFFGHNSIAKPENITALLVAVENDDGEETVRLHAEAVADFERKRLEIVNPALTSRPRAMLLEGPKIASPELDDLGDELEDLSLIEAVPPRKALAPPAKLTVARTSPRTSKAPQIDKGVASRLRNEPVTNRLTAKLGAVPARRNP